MSKGIEIPKLTCPGCIARDQIIQSIADKNRELQGELDAYIAHLSEDPEGELLELDEPYEAVF